VSPTPRPIVIGYDGTDRGADALALGARLADALDASIVVASAVADPNGLLGVAELERMSEERAGQSLRRAAELLAPRDVETAIVCGFSAGHALNDFAEDERPLALVVGSSHRGRVGQVFLGSVGESLLSGAPCPVAVAPHGYAARPDQQLSRVGVALDGSPEASAALVQAEALVDGLGAEIDLIAVAPRSNPDLGGAVLGVLATEHPSHDEAEERLRKVIDQAAQSVGPERRRREHLLHGDPAATLARHCQRLDLLVVGSRHYGPLRRVLLGSVSRELSRTAPAPLLVVPRGAGKAEADAKPALAGAEPAAA